MTSTPAIHTTPLVEVVVTYGLQGRASARLHELLIDAMALRPARLVVDLTECDSLDAGAVDMLLDAHRRMWNAGGRLTLRSPSQRLLRILTLARVEQVFDIV